jgi:hypothetical protein
MKPGRNRATLPLALALAVLAGATPAPSHATTSQRNIAQLGVGLCGANNPANNTSLRRLVTGLRNVSAGNVSVVCGQWGDDNVASGYANPVAVYFHNDRAAGYNVTCTLTMGVPNYGQVAYTRTSYIAAGASGSISWNGTDYGSQNLNAQWVNLQCSLPQSFTLQEVQFIYSEEVGT